MTFYQKVKIQNLIFSKFLFFRGNFISKFLNVNLKIYLKSIKKLIDYNNDNYYEINIINNIYIHIYIII